MSGTEDETLRWECPGCDHEIIGLADADEAVELADEHLRDEHGTSMARFQEDGLEAIRDE